MGSGFRGVGTLNGEDIVIRAGMSKPLDLAGSALRCRLKLGYWGLTFWSWPGMTPEQIAVRVREEAEQRGKDNPVPHPVIRAARVDQLPGINEHCELRPTGADGHHSFVLPLPDPEPGVSASDVEKTWNEWWVAIGSSLGEPITNPARR